MSRAESIKQRNFKLVSPMTQRWIELNAWLNSSGDAPDSWLRPGRDPARIFTLEHYVHAARTAYRGVFGNVFTSDRPQLVIGENQRPEHTLDPFVLFASVLAQVPDIGGIITASTTYSEPYTLARQIQSLHLLSGGRIAWNIVTSWNPAIAANYSNQPLPDRESRYARAEEFVEVVLRLWESWRFEWDGSAGHGQPQPIHHRGAHFHVAGPLNVPTAPWGRPRLVQAGGSDAGIALAARHADAVYAPSSSLQATQALRKRLRDAARAIGRAENHLPQLVPVLIPILTDSEAKADALKKEWLQALADDPQALQQKAELAAEQLGVRHRDFDRPLQAEDFGDPTGSIIPIGSLQARCQRALDEKLSLRDLVQHEALPGLIGTPEQIAHHIVQWFRAEAVDGFTIIPRYLPDDLEVFVDTVIPLLQESGHYPRSYVQRVG